ncbi:MAG: sulfatase family protein [Actinomycetota bacterium]
MNRFAGSLRRAIFGLAIASLTALAATPGPLQADPGEGNGGGTLPNVLVIMTDDQRADGTLDVMPATQRWFGEGGTRFPNTYATTPLCCPSRATLFSGRYAHNHGVTDNAQAGNLNHAETLQAYLQAVGYRTGIFGKFLNLWNVKVSPPLFNDWATFKGGYFGKPFNINGTLRRTEGYSTRFIARRAVRFLRKSEQRDSRPWLMFVTPFAPHVPARAEPAYTDAPVAEWEGNPSVREVDRSDKPSIVQEAEASPDSVQRRRARQLRTLMSVDDLVSTLAAELRRLGEEDGTLAFFLSDNGLMWGDHGTTGKSLPYSASIEIPLLVRWPGTFPAGAVDDRLATTVDIAPTILHAAGLPTVPGQVDGRSLLEPWDRDRVLTESWVIPWASLRTRSYQYTEWYNVDGNLTFREYYDLEADPWQLTNLLGDGVPANDPPADLLASLSADLARDRLCAGVEGPAACP